MGGGEQAEALSGSGRKLAISTSCVAEVTFHLCPVSDAREGRSSSGVLVLHRAELPRSFDVAVVSGSTPFPTLVEMPRASAWWSDYLSIPSPGFLGVRSGVDRIEYEIMYCIDGKPC